MIAGICSFIGLGIPLNLPKYSEGVEHDNKLHA
jgi:hypothetical protein